MSGRSQKGLGSWAAVIAMACVGLVLAGCGSSAIPVSPLQPLKSPVVVSVKWKNSIGSSDNAVLDPLLSEGTLYVGTEKGELYAMDPASGNTLWHVKTGERFSAGIGSGDGHLLLGTKKGEVVAYNLKGELLWRSQLTSELMVAPQAADGVVVARTADGHIVGLGLEDGARRWQITRPLPVLVLRGVGGTTLSHGAAFIGLPGGKLLALNVSNGNVGWESSVSLPRGATELERVNDVVGNPVVGQRDVCTATYQGKAACLDASSGAVLWSRDLPVLGAIAASDNRLYVADEKGNVTALSRMTGIAAWKSESLAGRHLSPPVLTDDYVVAGDVEGVVHFLSRMDGVESGRVSTAGDPIVHQPLALGDNRVLIQTRAGKLFAITP